MKYVHTPVLLSEALQALRVFPGGRYIDCTFGGGGFSLAIAEQGGFVLGCDIDEDALIHFYSRTDIAVDIFSRITLIHANFDAIAEHAEHIHFVPVHGVVFDLGVSSYHLDTPSRGFSFMRPGPLDMRFNRNSGITAGRLLDILDADSLARLFRKFSDERHAYAIADAIVAERESHKYRFGDHLYWERQTTARLAELISKVVGRARGRIHPATKVFQALRMAVNDEIGNLERGLQGAWRVLGSGGFLVVISFHSVEDRVVKDFMRLRAREQQGVIIGDVITPHASEIVRNPRSRSAKMRILEKS